MKTTIRTARRRGVLIAALAAVTLLGFAPGALAGELTLAWVPANDAMTAGYELERLDAAGEVVQTIDTGPETLVVIENLPDNVMHRFRIRPYDAFGHRAREASAPFESMPAPSITGLSVTPRIDGEADVVLEGANFVAGSRLVLSRRGTEAHDVAVESTGRLVARVTGLDHAVPLGVDELLVAPPVRKGVSFVLANPALLDVDRSGHVSEADARLIAEAFGAARGDAHYDRRLDPNDDGVIDGEDRDLARSATKSRGRRVIDGR